MQRFLYRVQYTDREGLSTYTTVCVRAADGDEAAALADVKDATARYMTVTGATRTLTLLVVTADV